MDVEKFEAYRCSHLESAQNQITLFEILEYKQWAVFRVGGFYTFEILEAQGDNTFEQASTFETAERADFREQLRQVSTTTHYDE